MAAAASASQPGYIGVTIYVAEDVWKQLRHQAMDDGLTGSAIGASLMEHYVAGQIGEAAAVKARALEITQGRRKRSERETDG